MRTIQAVWVLAVGLLLAACGGGNDTCYGGPGSTVCSTASGTSTATSLTVQLSTLSVANSGAETVTATAIASSAGGKTVSGVPVTFTVDSGATYTPAATATDSKGVVTATVAIGTDKANRTINVVATSGSLTASTSFVVTGAALSSTAIPAVVPPLGAGSVEFLLLDSAKNPMVGQAISIDAGIAGIADGVTDAKGKYTFNYTAPATTGALKITADAGGVEWIQTVQVQTTSTVPPAGAVPTTARPAANPSVVAPNTAGSTSNGATVSMLFFDANNNPIPNMRVRFSVNNNYGTFSAGDNLVYSDSNGVAVTGFIPAERTSPKDGVIVTACYSQVDFASCSEAGVKTITTTLTIASSPLSITIGTDLLIVEGDLTYKQRFVVTAVDIAGNPKANVDITPSIDLQYYFKGRYVYNGTQWVLYSLRDPVTGNLLVPPKAQCQNEDINRTGLYQQAQDVNLNGQIDPSKADVSIAIVGSSKTDANGKIVLQIEYPKNLGSWIQYQILVSAGVAGTEGRKTWVSTLGVPVSAIKAEGAPPFIVSPYGIVTYDAVPSAASLYGRPSVPVPPCQNAD